MNTDETRSLTEQLSRARDAGDREAILALLTEDVVLVPPPSFLSFGRGWMHAEGSTEVTRSISGEVVQDIFKPETVERRRVLTIADGDVSMVRTHMTAEFLGGAPYDNQYSWVYFWRGGKVYRIEVHCDTLRYVQMGIGSVVPISGAIKS